MPRIALDDLHQDQDLDVSAMQATLGGYYTRPGLSSAQSSAYALSLLSAMQRTRSAGRYVSPSSLTARYNVNPYSTLRYTTPYNPYRYNSTTRLFVS